MTIVSTLDLDKHGISSFYLRFLSFRYFTSFLFFSFFFFSITNSMFSHEAVMEKREIKIIKTKMKKR